MSGITTASAAALLPVLPAAFVIIPTSDDEKLKKKTLLSHILITLDFLMNLYIMTLSLEHAVMRFCGISCFFAMHSKSKCLYT